MIKNIFLVIFISLAGIKGWAQDSIPALKILAIPFQSGMYFSDADKDISQYSGMNAERVRETFRLSLDATVSDKLGLYFPTLRLIKQKSDESYEELNRFYASLKFNPIKRELPKKEEEEKNPLKKLNKLFEPEKEQSERQKNLEELYLNYMSARITDTAFLNRLAEKYKIDHFLVITQFEIKTNYKNCIDLATKNYQRDFFVHYVLMDLSGKAVKGDILIIPSGSNENQIEKIIESHFGKIATLITHQVLGRT